MLDIYHQIKNKKYQLSEQFQNSIERKETKTDTPNKQIHDHSLSWFGTVTSIKRGGIKKSLKISND